MKPADLALIVGAVALGMWGQYWRDKAKRQQDAIEFMLEDEVVVIPDDVSSLTEE